MNEMVRVHGLAGLMRAVAKRIEGEADGLSRESLNQWAERMDKLERVADCAAIVLKGCGHSKSPAMMVVYVDAMLKMRTALREAGYKVV